MYMPAMDAPVAARIPDNTPSMANSDSRPLSTVPRLAPSVRSMALS
jgi:hypothetical protein